MYTVTGCLTNVWEIKYQQSWSYGDYCLFSVKLVSGIAPPTELSHLSVGSREQD